MRKTQITMFIILGIIVISLFGVFHYLLKNIGSKKDIRTDLELHDSNSEILPIKMYIEECLLNAVKESIYDLSESGWHYFEDELTLVLDYQSHSSLSDIDYLITYAGNIPYYYNGSSNIPAKEFVESQFSMYINEYVNYCVDYSIFKDMGFNISEKGMVIDVVLENNMIYADLKYPIEISKGNNHYLIDTFRYSHEYNYEKISESVSELVNAVIEEPYYQDITLILTQYYATSVIEYDDCTDIYIIIDNESMRNEEQDVIFRFAVKFGHEICNVWSDEVTAEFIPKYESKENSPPILEPVSFTSLNVNENLMLQINAKDPENDTIFYLASGILENKIHVLRGLINYTPAETDKGFHRINVTVVDIYGNHDTKFFSMEVK